MKTPLFPLLTAMVLAAGVAHAADDACTRFKWDVTREVALFAGTPKPLVAGHGVDDAGALQPEVLYAVTLQPQEGVKFRVAPSKKMLDDGAHGGLLKLRVTEAGTYRVAIDSGFWLDVLAGDKPLPSLDFNGSAECAGPRKIVVYELPAGTDLTLQLSAASVSLARLSVTRVTAARP